MVRKLALVVGFVVAGGSFSSARAITLGSPTDYCILAAGGIQACATATFVTSGSTLTVDVLLHGTAGTKFTFNSFGFYYKPTDGPGSLMLATSPGSNAWDDMPSTSISNLSGSYWLSDSDRLHPGVDGGGAEIDNNSPYKLQFGYGTCGSSAECGLVTGQWTFTISGTPNWQDVNFAWRGQSWEDASGQEIAGGSIKCWSTGESSDNTLGCSSTVVPEPATMALLATGLVGLGGAGLIRRRKNG